MTAVSIGGAIGDPIDVSVADLLLLQLHHLDEMKEKNPSNKIATAVFQVSSLILFKTPAEKDVLIKLHICSLNLIIIVFVSSN